MVVSGGAPVLNNKFYLFDFDEEISWVSLSAEQLVPTPSPNSPNNTSTTNPPSISSNEFSSNKTTIVGLSVGLGILGIASIVAFALVYRRIKNKSTADTTEFITPDDAGILQISSDDNIIQQYFP